MAFEWQMVDEGVDEPEKIEEWLKQGFEPFALSVKLTPRRASSGKGDAMHHITHVFLKRMVNVERGEKATDAVEGQPSERETPPEVGVQDADN